MYSLKKDYSHFLGLPFIRQTQRATLANLQKEISTAILKQYSQRNLIESKSSLAHISFCMLTFEGRRNERKGEEMMRSLKAELQDRLDFTTLSFSRIKYFTRFNYESKRKEVSVIYMDIDEDEHFNKVVFATNLLVRTMLNEGIIRQNQLKRLRISYHQKEDMYKCDNYHLTLFRLKDVEETEQFKQMFEKICLLKSPLKFCCDMLDISTRFNYDSTGYYRPLTRVLLESKQ